LFFLSPAELRNRFPNVVLLSVVLLDQTTKSGSNYYLQVALDVK